MLRIMESVFFRVALFSVMLLVATAGLGLWLGDLHGQLDPHVLRWGTVHRLSGVLSALVGIAMDQGQLDSLDHKVIEYFPEYF